MILYHHPRQPDEGCMILVSDQEKGTATIDELEKRGFVIDKITFAPPAAARPPIANAAD
jgi:hypothetical protein